MEILSYHYKARVSFDELRNSDWLIQINDALVDAVVTVDADGTSATWVANGYSDTLDLDRNATYIVMRLEFSNETTSS